MEVKIKENRYGRYAEITALLQVGYKIYRVKQFPPIVNDTYERKTKWKVSISQMKSMIELTKLSDWLIKWLGEFDGQVDGWVNLDDEWHLMREEEKDSLLESLERFRRFSIHYDEEENKFELYSYTVSLALKPSNSLVVTLRI